jgi:hypothetical protein
MDVVLYADRVHPAGAAVVFEKVVYVPDTRNRTVVIVSVVLFGVQVLVTRKVTGWVEPMSNSGVGAGLVWVTVNWRVASAVTFQKQITNAAVIITSCLIRMVLLLSLIAG